MNFNIIERLIILIYFHICRMRELIDFLPMSNRDPVPQRYTEDPK